MPKSETTPTKNIIKGWSLTADGRIFGTVRVDQPDAFVKAGERITTSKVIEIHRVLNGERWAYTQNSIYILED